jgi:phosphoribosylanthranilate isomerase
VFVNERADVVADIAGTVGLTMVQLHGDESPDATSFDGLSTIKAVSARGDSVDEAAGIAGNWADEVTLLVDAHDPDRRGGTGQRADWRLARALTCMRPIILAGGLSPETVIEAIHQVMPFAVDVSSGVERSPGIKDRQRMRDLIGAVKYGWGWLQMNPDERWRASVQFRDAAPSGIGRRPPTRTASEMMR